MATTTLKERIIQAKKKQIDLADLFVYISNEAEKNALMIPINATEMKFKISDPKYVEMIHTLELSEKEILEKMAAKNCVEISFESETLDPRKIMVKVEWSE